MYQLNAGLLKSRDLGAEYEEVDLSSYTVKKLLSGYKEAYLVLSHYALTHKVTLRLRDAESLIVGLPTDPTVTAWLTSLGNASLPTTDGEPTVVQKRILARDVWQAGFTATLSVPSGSPLNDAPDADKIDIWVTRDKADYLELQQHALATVNGLMHRLDADTNGMYIKHGGETFAKSKNAILGLLSLEAVGKVTTHTITADMLYHPSPEGKFKDSTWIKLPFDSTGKTVGIVIGGYLHLLSKDTKVIGPHTLKVMMNRIPLLERYMVSRKLMNMTSMERFHEVSEADIDKDLYVTEGFFSNECLTELLTLSQSFLIELDTDNLSVSYTKTTNTFLPGRFYFEERPLLPLRTELGLLPSYVTLDENGVWVLCIDNNLRQNRTFNTLFDNTDRQITTEQRESDQVQSYHRGDLVNWSSESINIAIPTA